MSTDLIIRSGDDQPSLQYVLGEDLTGYTAKFYIYDPVTGVDVQTYDASIIDPTAGEVEVEINPTPDVGFYFARYELVDGAGTNKFTVPNSVPLSLMVTSGTKHEFSYTGNPSLRDIDKVRFLLQDTDTSKATLTDSEIQFLLDEYKNAYSAAAEAALIISAQYAGIKDKTVGPLSIRYGDMVNRYTALSASLRKRATRTSGAAAVFTGTKRDPIFKIGMGDNKGAGGYQSTDPTRSDYYGG